MDERQSLRQSMLRYQSEMDRVLSASFVNLPASLGRLIDAMECEPVVNAYLVDCTTNHLPDAFDAAQEVMRVAEDDTAVFGPFPEDHQAATAEAYLIVQELLHRRIKFHDPLFIGYASEPAHPGERFAVFHEEVILRLVNDVTAHLESLAQELGVERPASGNTEQEKTPKSAEQPPTSAFTEERLEALLAEMDTAARTLPEDDRDDALMQLEALRDELTGSHPKTSVVKVLLRVLAAIGGDVRYITTLGQLKACLETGGLC